jgi:hypothetical protein
MTSPTLQTLFGRLGSGLGGMFTRPRETQARVHIDPASHVTELFGAEAARPPLAIGVRLSNVRAEVIAREAVHE